MEFVRDENRIELTDKTGKTLACITFPEIRPGVVVINHTEVDSSLGGKGIAGKLTEEAANYIRNKGLKAELSCSYAIRWFSRHQEYRDILEDPEAEEQKATMLAGPACGLRR